MPLLGGAGLVFVAASIVAVAALRDPATLAGLESASGTPAPDGKASAPGVNGEVKQPGPDVTLTQGELDAATSPESLEQLGSKYPSEPKVWRKLVAAYGTDEKNTEPALNALRHLLDLESGTSSSAGSGGLTDLATEPNTQQIVRHAATIGTTADLAFDTMRSHMGSSGLDLLYDVATSTTMPLGTRDRAWALLRDDATLGPRESPALRIAVDLKRVDGCERKPFLPQAERDGDKRSLTYLQPYLLMHKGCGILGLGYCSDCWGDRSELNRAITAINARASSPR